MHSNTSNGHLNLKRSHINTKEKTNPMAAFAEPDIAFSGLLGILPPSWDDFCFFNSKEHRPCQGLS